MLLQRAATAALLAWGWLLVARGGFWLHRPRLPRRSLPAPSRWPEVAVVIPARDEADTIGPVITAHLATRYPNPPRVILVDDGSTDGTAARARAAAGHSQRLAVLHAAPLAPGWTGKLWAQALGVAHARTLAPHARYLLLCDADIRLGPTTLPRIVALAERDRLGLASLMARLDTRGPWAGLLIPAFVFFFAKLYPFGWVAHPGRRAAAAAGGVMLVRSDLVARLELPAAIRGALIDDVAVAARIKRAGVRIWLGHATGQDAVSLRDNRALGSIWAMVRRTAYTQLRHSPLKLAGTVAGMGLLYLAPPAAALAGPRATARLGWAGWAAMSLAFAPTALAHRCAWAVPLLPLAALLYTAITLDSARVHATGRGGAWKGRTYPSASSASRKVSSSGRTR